MPEINNRDNAASLSHVLEEYALISGRLADLCNGTHALIEKLLATADIQFHSVQKRVKSKDKLSAKYADITKNYRKLDEITDLVGLRIITYYEDEVDAVAEMLRHEFSVDAVLSIDKRVVEPDHFAYFGLNLICSYKPSRLDHPEYKPYADAKFEVQITSILRHAWSEMEHDWYDLKDRFPPSIKRRFYRLAALLELAEQEFVEIRNSKKQHENAAFARVEAEVPIVPIDSLSLRAFIEQEPLVEEADLDIANLLHFEVADDVSEDALIMRSRLLTEAGFKTIEDVRAGLKRYGPAIRQYVEKCLPVWPRRPDSTYQKGISLFHLACMLFSSRGEAAFRNLLDELDVQFRDDFELKKQLEVAKQVLAETHLS